jgi:hypothetical protein
MDSSDSIDEWEEIYPHIRERDAECPSCGGLARECHDAQSRERDPYFACFNPECFLYGGGYYHAPDKSI